MDWDDISQVMKGFFDGDSCVSISVLHANRGCLEDPAGSVPEECRLICLEKGNLRPILEMAREIAVELPRNRRCCAALGRRRRVSSV